MRASRRPALRTFVSNSSSSQIWACLLCWLILLQLADGTLGNLLRRLRRARLGRRIELLIRAHERYGSLADPAVGQRVLRRRQRVRHEQQIHVGALVISRPAPARRGRARPAACSGWMSRM